MLTLMALLGSVTMSFAVDWAIEAFDDDDEADTNIPIRPSIKRQIPTAQYLSWASP